MSRVIQITPALGCGWLVRAPQSQTQTFFGTREDAIDYAYRVAHASRPAIVRVFASLGVVEDEWSISDRASFRRVGPDGPREVLVDH